MAKKAKPAPRKNDDDVSGVLIPAGLLIGFGLGFIFDNVAAGMFLGLGGGMALFVLVKIMGK